MTIKFFEGYREASCDLCHTIFIYMEGLDYYDRDDFFTLLEFLGWKKTWVKSEGRYTHVCHECKAKANEKFKAIRSEVADGLYSVADAKDF